MVVWQNNYLVLSLPLSPPPNQKSYVLLHETTRLLTCSNVLALIPHSEKGYDFLTSCTKTWVVVVKRTPQNLTPRIEVLFVCTTFQHEELKVQTNSEFFVQFTE